MGKLPLCAALVLTSACGRWGFEPGIGSGNPGESPDAMGATTPDGSPALLTCTTPSRFQVGAGSLSAISATGTPNGFAMFTVDTGGNLADWAYSFDAAGQLSANVENNAIDSNANGVIGVASTGSTVLVSALYGRPSATGTAIYAFNSSFITPAAISRRDGEYAAPTSLAVSGDGSQIAFVTVDPTSLEADAHVLDANGNDVGAMKTVIASAAMTNYTFVAPAGPGYAISYSSNGVSPTSTMLELLDKNLNIVAGPIETSDGTGDAYAAQVAWAATSQVYLASWHEKTATGDDDVWIELLGPNLEVVFPATDIAHSASDARVTSDGTGFSLTWMDYSVTPSVLNGAYVAPNGTTTARPVAATSGTPSQWVMIDRDGQSILVWTATGGTGPDLSFAAQCGS